MLTEVEIVEPVAAVAGCGHFDFGCDLGKLTYLVGYGQLANNATKIRIAPMSPEWTDRGGLK